MALSFGKFILGVAVGILGVWILGTVFLWAIVGFAVGVFYADL